MEPRLVKACLGKSYTAGGLNLPDIRRIAQERGLDSTGKRAEVLRRICQRPQAPAPPRRQRQQRQRPQAPAPPRQQRQQRQRPQAPAPPRQQRQQRQRPQAPDSPVHIRVMHGADIKRQQGPPTPMLHPNHAYRATVNVQKQFRLSASYTMYKKVPDIIAPIIIQNLENLGPEDSLLINILLLNGHTSDDKINERLNQLYHELAGLYLGIVDVESPSWKAMLERMRYPYMIRILEVILPILKTVPRERRNSPLLFRLARVLILYVRNALMFPTQNEVAQLNRVRMLIANMVLVTDAQARHLTVGDIYNTVLSQNIKTGMTSYVKFLLALSQGGKVKNILTGHDQVNNYMYNGERLSYEDLARIFKPIAGDQATIYRKGVNVHSRDQKVRNAYELLERTQGAARARDFTDLQDWFAHQRASPQIDLAIKAIGWKRCPTKSLVLDQLGQGAWPPLILSGVWSIKGKLMDGRELLGRLYRFGKEYKRGEEFDEIMASIVNALANSYDDKGNMVCNPGKAGRLISAVLQGRLKGVIIDQGMQQQQQEEWVLPIRSRRVLSEIWDAINTALQQIPDYYQTGDELDPDKYWTNIINLITVVKTTGLPGVNRRLQRAVHIPSLVLFIRAAGALEDITFEDPVDIPLNVLDPPIDELAERLPP